VNFVVALGARERIVGGAGHDELGARGAADRVYGGGGDDLIHGGRGHVLDGGPGNDLIIDTEGGATVRTGPGHDRVIVAGRGRADRVACSAGSHDTLIYADHGDTIAPTCGQRHARVRYRPPPTMSPRPARAAQAVSGDGSNENPFIAGCDDPGQVDCTASAFPPRTLSDLWSNEYVPAYQCQDDHPYLLNQIYSPVGTSLPNGVEVQGLGPIGVSIRGVLAGPVVPGGLSYGRGTSTGFPNSSATNWTFGTNSYQVILHCTSDQSQAWRP
jgi:hypothetical protein